MSSSAKAQGGQKRNRADGDPEEAGVPTRPRVSEVCSESTFDSGSMEIERIHSGLPALPEARKTEGAFEATGYFSADGPESRYMRCSGDSDCLLQDIDTEVVGRRGRRLASPRRMSKGSGSPQLCGPQACAAHTARPHPIVSLPVQQTCKETTVRYVMHAEAAASGRHSRAAQRGGAFTSFTSVALQQQMELLSSDEQSLLVELRVLRRDYDARVAALIERPILSPVLVQTSAMDQRPRPNLAPLAALSVHPLQQQHELQGRRTTVPPVRHGSHVAPQAPRPPAPQTVGAGVGGSTAATVLSRRNSHVSQRLMPPPPPMSTVPKDARQKSPVARAKPTTHQPSAQDSAAGAWSAGAGPRGAAAVAQRRQPRASVEAQFSAGEVGSGLAAGLLDALVKASDAPSVSNLLLSHLLRQQQQVV